MKGDPLWLPFGKERTKVIDDILEMKSNEYKDYIINPTDQLKIMKRNWGGKGTTPIDCPTWAIVSVDPLIWVEKNPCCIGSAESDSMKPICEECGLGCYCFDGIWNQGFIKYGNTISSSKFLKSINQQSLS